MTGFSWGLVLAVGLGVVAGSVIKVVAASSAAALKISVPGLA